MLRLHLGVMLIAIASAACTTDTEVARIAIPNTNLALVLKQDEKQMFRYQVFAGKKLASDNNFLGPHDYKVPSEPTVTVSGNTVKLTWHGPYITQFVEFDVSTCEITQDSNGTGRRKIPGCRQASPANT